LPYDVIEIKPGVDEGGGGSGFLLFRTNGGH
jgi:hypothetical protein